MPKSKTQIEHANFNEENLHRAVMQGKYVWYVKNIIVFSNNS